MNNRIMNNDKVLVHCVGGLGRTGTIVAAYLKKYHKLSSQGAIEMVRKSRSPRAIETKVQEDMVRNFEG